MLCPQKQSGFILTRNCGSTVRTTLAKRNTRLASGDEEEFKRSCYNLWRAIRAVRQEYRDKVQIQLSGNSSQGMWKGLHTITDFKGKPRCTANVTFLLPDKHYNLYAGFENHNTTLLGEASTNTPTSALIIKKAYTWRSFQCINTHKTTRPVGIPGRVIRV